ncbi:hypothetical protein KIPB_008119 [Kipferlia bialata]|uniref:THIF-type NAD/FAD binding fold domain-containing protein n=1 Tax=Kipferlia bialata TaxID=797122 RepID=A0A9K3GKJ4_9EUKA|nr:hypothetical protein KIPB_008119 [Kipferlia bialata]|eukprot:g8119.t1
MSLSLFPSHCVTFSNINRQLVAYHSTVGKSKVEVAAKRVLDLNPNCKVTPLHQFVTIEGVATLLDQVKPDVVADCIDSVREKIALIAACKRSGVAIVSSMGAARHRDLSKIHAADISKTSMCPLARKVRKHMKDVRREGRKAPTVAIYSSEEPAKHQRGDCLGSMCVITGTFGLRVGGEVLRLLLDGQKSEAASPSETDKEAEKEEVVVTTKTETETETESGMEVETAQTDKE